MWRWKRLGSGGVVACSHSLVGPRGDSERLSNLFPEVGLGIPGPSVVPISNCSLKLSGRGLFPLQMALVPIIATGLPSLTPPTPPIQFLLLQKPKHPLYPRGQKAVFSATSLCTERAVVQGSPALILLETKPSHFCQSSQEVVFSSPCLWGMLSSSSLGPSAVLELDAAQLQTKPLPGKSKTYSWDVIT